jgi:hypothetical protein
MASSKDDGKRPGDRSGALFLGLAAMEAIMVMAMPSLTGRMKNARSRLSAVLAARVESKDPVGDLRAVEEVLQHALRLIESLMGRIEILEAQGPAARTNALEEGMPVRAGA